MGLDIKPKKRKQSRKRPTAVITVTWTVYDQLDKIALDHNTSMSQVIAALLKEQTI